MQPGFWRGQIPSEQEGLERTAKAEKGFHERVGRGIPVHIPLQ